MDETSSAIFLGIVEGLTEFIPVSSTGHLILFGNAIGFTGQKADVFEVFIQLGAILAVLVLYWRRFLGFLNFSTPEDRFSGRHGIAKIIACCVPTLAAGFLLHSVAKQLFFPASVALALIVGGALFILIERFPRRKTSDSLASLSIPTCIGIGLFQCLSLWPGMSRSGSSIAGAMILGVERRVAAEFSFFCAVPIMAAAAAYDLLKNRDILTSADIPTFAIGFVVSFVVGIVSIRVLMGILKRFSLEPFGYYRIALGLLVLGML